MFTKIVAFMCLAVSAALAQATDVSISQEPTKRAVQTVYLFSGTNLTAQCASPSVVTTGTRAITRVSISAATNANPAVFTSTGHGFNVNFRPKVTISGATGNWTPVNGTFTATIVDANTFSIPVDSTGFGALTGTLVFSTTSPRTTVAEWSVLQYFYDGSNNLVAKGWLNGQTGYASKCSDASLTTTNVQ